MQASEQSPCCERLFLAFPIRHDDLTRPLLGQALVKHEVKRHDKDVRIAIIHFDLVCHSSGRRSCHLILNTRQARALVQIGSLNRKSQPAKSIADPLRTLLKDFKGLIQEYNLFCECV